mgnify:CR=1 FL=1
MSHGIGLPRAVSLVADLWNQFAYTTHDGRGRAFQHDGGLSALEDAHSFLVEAGVGKWDARGRMRAAHLDNKRCPDCMAWATPGLWSPKAKCCYSCERERARRKA